MNSIKSLIPENEIRELLPQKAPFTMVSHLIRYEKEAITTGLKIDDNNLFIEDGCFNESGMIENMAQSIALHTSYDFFLREEEAPVGYIGTISNVKLFKRPKLNNYITTKVEIIQEFMGITLVTGKVICNNEILLEAKMKTFITE